MGTGEIPIGQWLNALASRSPTPGGGAAAALCAATSSSLLGMVAQYTTGEKWAARADEMQAIIAETSTLRVRAIVLCDADADAFQAVDAAYKLSKDNEQQKSVRTVAIQAALTGAAEPPTHVGDIAVRLVELAADLAESGNPNVLSDVAVASSIARSALESAIANIEINRAQIRDEDVVKRLTTVISQLADAIEAADRVTAIVRNKVR